MHGGFKEELGEGGDEEKRGMRKVFLDLAWYNRRFLYFHLVCVQGGRRKGVLDLAWYERKEELGASCSDLATNSGHSNHNSGHY